MSSTAVETCLKMMQSFAFCTPNMQRPSWMSEFTPIYSVQEAMSNYPSMIFSSFQWTRFFCACKHGVGDGGRELVMHRNLQSLPAAGTRERNWRSFRLLGACLWLCCSLYFYGDVLSHNMKEDHKRWCDVGVANLSQPRHTNSFHLEWIRDISTFLSLHLPPCLSTPRSWLFSPT